MVNPGIPISGRRSIREMSKTPTRFAKECNNSNTAESDKEDYDEDEIDKGKIGEEEQDIPLQENKILEEEIQIPIEEKQGYIIIAIFIAVVSCIAAFTVVKFGYNIYLSDKEIRTLHEKKICNLNNLENRYPLEENNLWETLKYGIEEITNNVHPEGPSVYLFLKNANSKNQDIITDIANLASSCFDSNSTPIILKKEDFDADDYGIAIAKYIEKVHDGGVVVVLVHLNELPGQAARALHSICDKYSPIVRKAIIFLSLEIDPYAKGRSIDIAETTLRNIWNSSLTNNELEPLIVRVSDTVFHLQS